ncbi:MAG: hypothetical protein DMF84_12885 [Acidobacteria bacterium]|nr:MAG: hypothetical protein DMF84_12885 [Acidobacteriota bacterium]
MRFAPSEENDGADKRIVYILRSDADPARHYIGITNDVRERLDWHNDGPCGHTVHHRPWSVVVSMEFRNERGAARFEKYLKSGSGRAFTKRHFGAVDNDRTRRQTAAVRPRRDTPSKACPLLRRGKVSPICPARNTVLPISQEGQMTCINSVRKGQFSD